MITYYELYQYDKRKTVKPFFRENVRTSKNIILTENNKLVNEDGKICEIYNTCFINATKGLNLQRPEKRGKLQNNKI